MKRTLLLILLLGVALPTTPGPAQGSAEIRVTTTLDEYDENPEACSLREAVVAANTDAPFGGCAAGAGADTISLPSGAYQLERGGANEDGAATGDLDVTGMLTIRGDTAGSPVAGPPPSITAPALGDRALHVLAGATLTTTQLVLIGPLSSADALSNTLGAGIYNQGSLAMLASTLRSFQARAGRGGAIYNAGELRLEGVELAINSVGSGFGGAIYNAGSADLLDVQMLENAAGAGAGLANVGVATLRRVWITGNQANVLGGGVYNTGTLSFANGQIGDNRVLGASGYGGGIFSSSTGFVSLSSATVYSNSATLGGGIYSTGGPLQLRSTIVAANLPGDCVGALRSAGFNLAGDSSCALMQPGDQQGVDVGLVGYLARPRLYGPGPGSPAIDRGAACPALDLALNPRPRGAACDVGSVEVARLLLPLLIR